MNYDDMAYVQWLKTIADTVNMNTAEDTYQNANVIIQYFAAPYDKVTLGSTVLTALNADPSNNLVWGSTSVTSGFTWDHGGTYDAFFSATYSTTDTLTLAASASVTSTFAANLQWGSAAITPNWSWNIGAVYQ